MTGPDQPLNQGARGASPVGGTSYGAAGLPFDAPPLAPGWRSSSNTPRGKRNSSVSSGGSLQTSGSWRRRGYVSKAKSREERRKLMVILAIGVAVVLLTGVERLTFKMMVDRLGPYHYMLPQAVVVCFVVVMAPVVMYKFSVGMILPEMRGFPTGQVCLMALLDTVQLVLLTVAARAVTPTLTVLLLQALTPFTVITSWLWQGTQYSTRQWIGATLMLLAVVVAVADPILSIHPRACELQPWAPFTSTSDPTSLTTTSSSSAWVWSSSDPGDGQPAPGHGEGEVQVQCGHDEQLARDRTAAWCSAIYFCSCIPAALSSVYKERALIAYGRPVDPHFLNFRVGCYQLAMVIILSPVAYRIQKAFHGLFGGEYNFIESTRRGWKCWLLCTDEDREHNSAQCKYALLLVVAYIVSTLLLLHCFSLMLTLSVTLAQSQQSGGGSTYSIVNSSSNSPSNSNSSSNQLTISITSNSGGVSGSTASANQGSSSSNNNNNNNSSNSTSRVKGGVGAGVGGQVMHRSSMGGFVFAFGIMCWYAFVQQDITRSLNLITGLTFLVVLGGFELYHMDAEPDRDVIMTFSTAAASPDDRPLPR